MAVGTNIFSTIGKDSEAFERPWWGDWDWLIDDNGNLERERVNNNALKKKVPYETLFSFV